MTKLEEIKQRLDKALSDGDTVWTRSVEFSDLQYLLNEVERLNKIKAKAIEGLNSYRDAAFEIHGEVYAVGSVAKETLKELEEIK